MNNYDYPVGSDTKDAPWNQPDTEPEYRCPVCGSESLIWDRSGNKTASDKIWDSNTVLVCRECWHKGTPEEFEYEYEYEPEYEPEDYQP